MLRHWLRRPASPPPRREAPQAEWLEPRLLFSADIGAGLLPEADADPAGEVRMLSQTGEYAQSTQAQTLAEAYATTGLHFEQNLGQENAAVDFAARGNGYAIALSGGDAEIVLTGASAPVRLDLVGAQHAQAHGEGLLQARSNYLLGSDPAGWHTGIANYSAVRYDDVYQGIDVRYYGNQRQLEYDFIVAAGADAAQIRLRFEGAAASLDADGNLVLRTPEGRELRFAAPVSYQQGANGREAVASAYVLHADGTIGFQVGAYDAGRELVIDPVLQYATYFGGNAADTAVDIAIGSDGSVYVTGNTRSTGGLLGSLLGGLLGGTGGDIYVAKFNADLSSLIWTARVGGTADDDAMALAVDSLGRAVVTGTTKSSDFTTVNADDGSRSGSQDAVVFKLNANGDGFVFSTYFGDSAVEIGYGVAIDAADNIYVTGLAGGGPNGQEAFVNKYSTTGVAAFQVLYGGSSDERGLDIAVNGAGDAIYVVGTTNSGNLVTTGGHATSRPGKDDGFLARFDASGSLVYGTYIGATENDTAVAVAADAAGRAYVIGQTHKSDESGFATTANALRTTGVDPHTGYLRIYDTNLTGSASLLYSTFLGGSGDNNPTGVALMGDRVVVVSQSGSTDAAVTPDAVQATNPDRGMHLVVINPVGSGAGDLQYGTFYGTNVVTGGVATSGNKVYVAATTNTAGLASSGGYLETRPGGPGDALLVGLQWVNDAPVLAGANNLPSILEDSVPGNGMLVTALLAGQVTDANGIAGMGIAVTGADSSNGTWQYSLDNGANWVAMVAPSAGSALLLGGDARVRFVPAPNYNGSATLSFRAWDRTSGSAGATADTTGNGGSSAFSTAIRTASITVQPVNDLPVAVAASASGAEDAVSIAITLGGSDVDGAVVSVTLQALPGGGLLYTDASLSTLAVAGFAYAGNALTFYFVPAGDFNGSVQFGYAVTDNLGATGTATATITVTAVDDATVAVDDGVTVDEDNTAAGNVLANDTDVDDTLAVASFQVAGDATSYLAGQVATIAGFGSFTLAADGSYSFAPAANWNGNVPAVSYATNTGATATLRITVDAVDDPSSLQDDTEAIAEDGVAGGNVLANDGDIDSALAVASFTVAGDATAYFAGDTATLAGVGTLRIAADGNYVFTPLAHWNGGVPVVTYTTNTGATATLALTVNAVDDPTLVADDSHTANEDDAAVGNVLANDSDVDNVLAVATFQVDGSTYNAGQTATIAGIGSITLAANGAYTFTPLAHWNGAVPILGYTTNTGATATLTLTVTAVDDATSAQDDSLTIGEEGVANGNVLGNDSDVDSVLAVASFTVAGDAATYAAGATATIAGIGSIMLAANGNYVFTPLANWNGAVPLVSYTTNTGAVATLTLVVNAVDDPTAAGADGQTVNEDNPAAGNVLANDTDVDNVLAVATFQVDGSTYNAGQTATIAGIGAITLAANGAYTFTPLANWNGAVPVLSYTTNTGATSTLTLAVAAVDDATDVQDDSLTIGEEGVANGNVLGNDSDVDSALAVASFTVAGDAATYAAGATATIAGIGSITLAANGNYVFTPSVNWNGAVPLVSYTTNTGAVATLTLVVNAVDDPTSASADSQTVNEGNPATGNVLANDSDVDDILSVASFQVAGDSTVHAAGASVTLAGIGSLALAADGSYTFTPLADWNGSVPTVTYTTNTGAIATLALTVAAVDDATVVTADSQTVDEDNSAVGNVLANDSDVDNVLAVATFQVDGSTYNAGQTATIAGIGSITLAANGAYTFTPLANWNGAVPVLSYTTNTGATATLTLAVAAVDDATNVQDDSLTIGEEGVANGNVLGNDSDVDSVLAVASFTVAGDAATYAAGATATIAGIGSITLAANGNYAFTPLANWNGAVPLVSYTTNTGAVATLTLTVNAVDDPTGAAADSNIVNEDNSATGNVLANDTDVDDILSVATFQVAGDATLYNAGQTATLAGIGSLTLAANGSYTFTPLANWNGAAPQLTYTTNTGVAATLDLTVLAVDDPSVLAGDTATGDEDHAVTGNVLANDTDVDTPLAVGSFQVAGDATVYLAGQSAMVAGVGSITLAADGSYSFTPLANWNGSAPLVGYTTTTGASATLAITLDAVDDATSAVADSATVDEDNTATGNVLANDSDVDSPLAVATFQVAGDATIYNAGQSATIAGVGTITLAADGSYSFTPVANWNGVAPHLSYTTNTGAVATLAITVDAVDDATVVATDAQAVAEDTAATGNVLANDSDADGPLAVATFQVAGDATTYNAGQAATIAGIGTVTLAADGSYVFTPLANWNGAAPQLTYTTNTGAISTLALTVTAVNDAPVLLAGTVANQAVAEGATPTSLGLAGVAYGAGGGADEAAQALAFTVTAVPSAGFGRIVLADGSTTVLAGATYTLAQLRGMQFVAAPGVTGGTASFRFSVSDNAGGDDTLAQALDIRVVNQAPVLTGANALPTILEDAVANAGMRVADLLAGHASDPNGVHGIAVVAAGGGEGSWQFSRDGGATWSALAGVSAGAAELLALDARVRFVPAADWNGLAAGLVFRAWDGTGNSSDTTLHGGEAPFSIATATASVRVTPVNDAPFAVSPAPIELQLATADRATPLGLDVLGYAPGGAGDEAWQAFTVTVTALPPATLGTLFLADGTTAVEAGRSYSLSELQGMLFLPAAANGGQSGNLAWTLRDDGGTADGGVDSTSGTLRIVAGATGGPELAPAPAPAPAPITIVAPPPATATPVAAPAPVAAAPSAEARARESSVAAAIGDALLQAPNTGALLPQATDSRTDTGHRAIPLESARSVTLRELGDRAVVTQVGFLPGADFLVTGFAQGQGGAGGNAADDLRQSLRSGGFVDELDRLREKLRQDFDLDRTVSISVAGLSLGVSVVYVLWLVRGGVLVGSYLSALPAWRLLDPLPVLAHAGADEEDDEDDALAAGLDAQPDPLRGVA